MRPMIACVLLVGCGGSEVSQETLCQRLSGWDAAAHQGDCQNHLSNSYTEAGCLAASSCNDGDLIGLRSYADCMDSLPVCAKASEIEYLGMLMGCQNILDVRVRFQCASAL